MDDATGHAALDAEAATSIPEPHSTAARPPHRAQPREMILLGTVLPCHVLSCLLKVHPPPTSVSAFLLQPFKVLSDWLLTCVRM